MRFLTPHGGKKTNCDALMDRYMEFYMIQGNGKYWVTRGGWTDGQMNELIPQVGELPFYVLDDFMTNAASHAKRWEWRPYLCL